jgi:hypothetical protein
MPPAESQGWIPAEINTETPSAARIYDYLLGGGHNFKADRAIADQVLKVQPNSREIALRNRAFLRRSVRFMLDEGVRQFLDLGSGIPTVGNVHEIAQKRSAGARVVYVDAEGVAVAHSQLMLDANPDAGIVHADVLDPDDVLGAHYTRELLDLSQPVGLLAITIGHYLPPERDPFGAFRTYRGVLASGSFIALTHLTNDFQNVDAGGIVETMKSTQNHVFPRSRAEVLELVGDFELVSPGLVTTSRWRPDEMDDVPEDPQDDGLYAGVARKP